MLGTALALFFNLHLRGSWFVRGVLILPMLLTPVVVGLMWRALLNPDWGMVNWLLSLGGLPQPLWTGDPKIALLTLVLVDSWQWTPFVMVIVFARLQALPQDVFEASAVDGADRRATLAHITLPMLAPAIVFAAIFRAIDAFRSFDVVFGLTYGGPGRMTTTLSFYAWENGFSFQRYGYASVVRVRDGHRVLARAGRAGALHRRAQGGRGMTARAWSGRSRTCCWSSSASSASRPSWSSS